MKKKIYPKITRYKIIGLLLLVISLPFSMKGQFNFTGSRLNGSSITHPTSLQFGPDARLYVAQEDGNIKILTLVKNGPNNYAATATETIQIINQIPNHNDDGSSAPAVTKRQVTGMLVAGTAAQPIIYVSSSDSRVGGPNGDLNLDTNSGILSLLSWNGSTWTKVDLVRGLPRSEENHSVNGMQLDQQTNTLLLAVGGMTNAGSPSINFAFTTEYALSAAILSIDLNAIEAMPLQGSGNTAYKYDLPTVDDPTRVNNGADDVNDPFGGNDGLNQARIVPGGPVQIFAPGFRNVYDVLITKTPGKEGRIYTIDNGANPGWGGYPSQEGPGGNATNEYIAGEPGSTGPGPNEPQVDNLDNLHYIGNISTYVKGSYYGGHPNPIRANPTGAGLYTNNGSSGVWRTSISGPNPLPANWPPAPTANPVESDFLMPGSTSPSILNFFNSTNGLAEYTASNFNNALKGNLLTVDYDGKLWRIIPTDNGTGVTNNKASVNKLILDAPFAANFGAVPLDVVARGDGESFPGTIWVALYASNAIEIFEPGSNANCTGLDNNLDDDNDGYTNADEIDNGTNSCSAASKPADWDLDLISDLNDPDDDNDGKPDETDFFQRDANNGLALNLPVQYNMFANDPGTGFLGLGFTGWMSNQQPGNNYLKTFDPNNLIGGGAAGVLSVVAVTAKDALGTSNNQENAFQFGVNVSSATGPFTVDARMIGPFFNNQTPSGNQSQGIYIGTGDQSNYLKIVLNANGGQGGIQVVYENADVPSSNQYAINGSLSGISTLDLYLAINPVTGMVHPQYAINGGAKVNVGAPIPLSGVLLNTVQGAAALAVGIISTSGNGPAFTAGWDYMYVTADPVDGIWTTVAPSNVPKWVGFSVPFNNKMYVFSGFDNPNVHTTSKVERYDPVTNTWTFMSDMPNPVTHAGITSDSDKVYVAGGFLGGLPGDPNSNLLQIYNITTNSWSTGPALPVKSGGNALVRVGRQLHSFGGLQEDRQTGAATHFVLDLNNMGAGWTNASPMPMPRCHFASACVAGKIYTFGGQLGHDGPYADANYVHVYDPSTDTWTRLQDMPYVRSHSEPATFVMDGKVYLVGGRSGADNNILGKVTYYDPGTDSWTEDIPLPAGVTLFGPAAEVIGNEIFVSNGGLNTCCAPQTTTRKRTIAKTPVYKTGFLPGALNISVNMNSITSKNAVLWVLSGSPSYTLTTTGLPSWLTVSPSGGIIDVLGGTEIKITANATGVAAGNYSGIVTAKAPGYPDVTLTVNCTVAAVNIPAFYVYGKVPPGEVDMKLSDAGSTGMSQFAQALQDVGFTPVEKLDADVTLNAATLNQYKVIILGSNNRRFTSAEQAAVSAWVNAGGGLVAWSDAAFGWQNGGINSTDGLLSDNDLTQQFGMQFLRDNGSVSFTLNQWKEDHYINRFNKNGGIAIKAEGVSPVRTTAPATILADIPVCCNQLNPLDGTRTAADAALSVAKIGQGRVACYFDRNAFWNAGDGTRLSEVDNKVFAQRLILWASGALDPQPANLNTYRINAGGPAVTNSIGSFSEDKLYSPAPGEIYSVTNPIAGTTDDAIYQTERYSTTDNGSFSYNLPVTNGTYKVILHFAEIYWTNPGQRRFDVSIENNKVLDNYDMVEKAGPLKAIVETFTANVNDGMLNINFNAALAEGGLDRPKVSAIEVLPIADVNQIPVANAGPDKTVVLPQSSITLSGSGTDADGTIVEYKWAKISGSGIITDATTATATITGLTAGVSVFELVVKDNTGAVSVADQVTVTVSSAQPISYRINAGGPAVTNSIGTFSADQLYSPAPGEIYSVTNPIAGTTDDAIYQTERYSTTDNGSFSYNLPVTNGTYKVILHFAELYWTNPGQRRFDVSIENNKVLDNYDMVERAGPLTAIVEKFTVNVTDGMLNIIFNGALAEGGLDRPKVSAIEVLPLPAGNQIPVANAGPDKSVIQPQSSVTLSGSGTDADGTIVEYKWARISGKGTITDATAATASITGLTAGVSVFQLVVTDNAGAVSVADQVTITVSPAQAITYRINAGGPAVTNSIGTFSADQLYSPTPGEIFSVTNPIAGTTDDAIYQTERYATTDNGSFSYNIPVVAGNYTVILHFAEIYWTAPGQRRFDVSIENTKVLNDYDIFQKVGSFTATKETFPITVTDGMLNINFTAAVSEGGIDRPKVSAIEVINTGEPSAPLIVYPNPNTNGKFWLTPNKIFSDLTEFTLYSSTGILVKSGSLQLTNPTMPLSFDLSKEMKASGQYYLHLAGKRYHVVLKLMKY